MASQSRRLAEAHRLAQVRIGGETMRLMDRLYPELDLSNIEGTTSRWLRVTVPVVMAQFARSAGLAGDYATAARALDRGVDIRFTPPQVVPNAERIATSLRVTGPARARSLSAGGAGRATVRREVLASSSRSAMRLALAGGRETITSTVRSDTKARWARITSGRPCAFCAMLATRGPVYRGEESAGFEAHDGCGCSAMIVYDRLAWTPEDGPEREFYDLWFDTTKGLSGKDALNTFRRAYENLPAV